MSDNIVSLEEIISPNLGETPSEYAERLGIYYTSIVADEHKKLLGQFFTPIRIAHFMADFSNTEKRKIKILDPGCGIGILTTALTEKLIGKNSTVKVIELVAFENDVDILPLAENCFIYLGKWLHDRGISFTFFLCKNDFILHNSLVLNNKNFTHKTYDFIICNPPYFKLPNNDPRAIAAKQVIYGQTNIYSIFLLIAARLLNKDGQLIFITPRSFCSGNYFRLFREIFFSIMDLKKIHLFNSRKDAFKRDKVLQENIIIVATKNDFKPDNDKQTLLRDYEITVSYSNKIDDLSDRRIKKYKISNLINFNSYQKILHLPSSDIDEKIIQIFKTWTGSLKSYNFKISTGPVVGFRSEGMIKFKKSKNTVPLIWLHNVEPMKFTWPRNSGFKGKPKEQYIVNDGTSISRLIKNKNYVLVRRFSTKDDNRRLIATPYFSDTLANMEMIGIENHINYIYHTNTELSTNQTLGLAGLLNSRIFDMYFRTFNGNINVSATELRDFPLPELQLIESLGQRIKYINKMGVSLDIDSIVSEVFNLSIDLTQIYG